MESYRIAWTKRANKDLELLSQKPVLVKKLNAFLEIIKINPNQHNFPFELLKGDLEGCYSFRLNIQHRVVYQIEEDAKTIKILRAWSHYE